MLAVGLAMIVSAPWWVDQLFYSTGEPPGWDLLAVPLLAAAVFGACLLLTRKDRFLRLVMGVSLLERLAATGAFSYLSMVVYKGAVDAVTYVHRASALTDRFYSTGQFTFPEPIWSNNFVILAAHALFLLIWPSFVVGMVVFSLVGFAGQYLMYRAFAIAYPRARQEVAAVLIFLTPSIVFWTSALGKDSLSLFFLGVVLYGAARFSLQGRKPLAIALVCLGVLGTFLVRPHVGAMVAIAFAVPYTLSHRSRTLATAALKTVLLPALILASIYLVANAADFVGRGDAAEVSTYALSAASANRLSDSGFGPASVQMRVLQGPLMFFRPFPWEIHNPQSVLAAVEALLLLLFGWRLRRHLLRLFRTAPGPVAWFMAAFVVEFVLVFSVSVTNFGLLVRERVMAEPFVLLLLCLAAGQQLPAKRRAVPVSQVVAERERLSRVAASAGDK